MNSRIVLVQILYWLDDRIELGLDVAFRVDLKNNSKIVFRVTFQIKFITSEVTLSFSKKFRTFAVVFFELVRLSSVFCKDQDWE